jgi:glutamyl-Q tRNA(Asp) synthetase
VAFVTRFAPSPTGPLHLGHAYSAILAHDMAMREGGAFLLRIEDIDQSRCRPKWEQQIYDDLEWLGLWWADPVMRQSERLPAYDASLNWLWDRDYLYPCTCSRRDILDAASAPQEGVPLRGPDGLIYPGTCAKSHRGLPCSMSPRPGDASLRLAMSHIGFTAEARIGGAHWYFREDGPDHKGVVEFSPESLVRDVGDIVVSRKDMGTSYHLSVVLDDAAQGITHVFRGADLFEATKIHVALQKLLTLPTPIYHHHRLIRDANGKRLAKRDDARSIATYRSEGATPADIRRMVGL